MNEASDLDTDDVWSFCVSAFRSHPRFQEMSANRLLDAADRLSSGWRKPLLALEMNALSHQPISLRPRICWAGHLPMSMLDELQSSSGVGIIAMGSGSRTLAIRRRLPYLPISLPAGEMLRWAVNDEPPDSTLLQKWLRTIRRFLRRTRTDVIILTGLTSPGTRLVGLAAKLERIPVAFFAHGLPRPELSVATNHGLVDHWLCWTEREAAGLRALGEPVDRVHTIGPLRERLAERDISPTNEPQTVCWMGVRYRGDNYVSAIESLASSCERRGLDFFTAPTPLRTTQIFSQLAATT